MGVFRARQWPSGIPTDPSLGEGVKGQRDRLTATATSVDATATRNAPTLDAQSSDGVISFRLTRRGAGVFVERAQIRGPSCRAVHIVQFKNISTFLDWCDADQLRFSYPLVFSSLKRHGCTLLDHG